MEGDALYKPHQDFTPHGISNQPERSLLATKISRRQFVAAGLGDTEGLLASISTFCHQLRAGDVSVL
jgi:hypothetical protein